MNKNDEIAQISLEFVEDVMEMAESKMMKKTFYINRFAKKIHAMMQKERQAIYKETGDSSFEVLFEKYLEYDDAIEAAEKIREMVKLHRL